MLNQKKNISWMCWLKVTRPIATGIIIEEGLVVVIGPGPDLNLALPLSET